VSDSLGDRGQRWSSPQPNVTGLGLIASYGPRFWSLVIVIGAAAGLSAAGLVGLLRLIEHLTYGGHYGNLLAAVEHAASWRRVVALMIAAVVVALTLRLLGRRSTGGTEVSEAIWRRSGEIDLLRSLVRGFVSIVTVGMGVSLGREAAPQLYGAAVASKLSVWAGLPTWQRRLLVACGAGAGFAAVYNVPLGAALFAVEVMLGTVALPLVLPALLAAATSTAVAWIFLGHRQLYHVANYTFRGPELAFAVLIGPIVGLLAVGWTRLITAANHARPEGRARYLAPFGAFLVLGLVSLQYPQLLGNGRSIVQLGLVANLSFGLIVVLLLLKPLVTAACVASGAPGGLFTPTFAIGVLMAGACATIWAHIWPGPPVAAYTLIGGGAFLAAAMQGPLSATVLVVELTGHLGTLIVPTLVAVVGAIVVSRRLGAQSIYSARLAGGGIEEASPVANAAALAMLRALDEPSALEGIEQPPGGSG
jgi:H+/Cl- antiporter ClcA